MHARKIVLFLLLASLSSSCATVMTGRTDRMLVTSSPEGAHFKTNLGHYGQTPARIKVPGDRPLTVAYWHRGYHDQTHTIPTRLSSWVWGNLLFAGPIGLIVDISGPGYIHDADRVHAELVPLVSEVPVEERQRSLPEVPKETFEEWLERREKIQKWGDVPPRLAPKEATP